MKLVFGHFVEIGASDGLDIAYLDSRKCFSTFGNGKRSCIINKVCIISIIYAKKSQKSVFCHFIKIGWFDMADIAYSDKS